MKTVHTSDSLLTCQPSLPFNEILRYIVLRHILIKTYVVIVIIKGSLERKIKSSLVIVCDGTNYIFFSCVSNEDIQVHRRLNLH